ncbi:inositol monophosphatase [bacterium]|nr:inositol monophosphatase [bacterium]
MGQIKKIDLVCDLIYQASKISKKSFRTLEEKDISAKEGFDLVTKVDQDSELFLKEGLYQIDEKAGFLGEESGKQDSLDSDKIWIVDPIDGTRNFVQGLPFFSISVALASKDLKKIYLGAIYDVVHDEMFIAEKGMGSYLKQGGKSIQMQVSEKKELEGSMIATGFPHKEKDRIKLFSKQFEALFNKSGGIRRMGSAALDLAYTACGRFDCFWEGGLSVWDIAAGVLIVDEAGGKVSDFHGEDSFMECGDIVASNSYFHEELIAEIRIDEND